MSLAFRGSAPAVFLEIVAEQAYEQAETASGSR
jgi:hypothetical protein